MRVILLGACLSLCWAVQAAESPIATFICDGVSDSGERAQCLDRAAAMTRDRTAKPSEKGVPWLSMFWPVGWWVVYYAFGLLIGRYIYRDAKAREWIFLGIRPIWWGLLALFDPAFGLLVYWALHYSRFAQSYHEAIASPTNAAPTA